MNSQEFEILQKKISEIRMDLSRIEGKFMILEGEFAFLNQKINRKLQGIKRQEEEEEPAKPKNLNPVEKITPFNEYLSKPFP